MYEPGDVDTVEENVYILSDEDGNVAGTVCAGSAEDATAFINFLTSLFGS